MQVFAPLVGVSFRGKDAKEMVKELTPDDGDKLSLEAEPDNEYDSNAVKVIMYGVHVGYLSRENNQAVAEALAEGRPLTISIAGFENSIKPVLMIEDAE